MKQKKDGNDVQFVKDATKETICESLMSKVFLTSAQGYSQAYVDFFYITHDRTPQEITPSEKYTNEVRDNRLRLKRFHQDEMNLKSLEQRLIVIDKLASDERWNEVLNKQMEIASYFLTEFEEYHVATYFYRKAIKLGQRLKNNVQIAMAMIGYAKCNDLFDRPDEAIYTLEEAIKLCKGQNQTLQEVSNELITIYKKMALKYENDIINPEAQDKALEYYVKCLDVCSRAEDTIVEAQVAYKIGQIYFKRGDYDKAIEKQNQYLEISTKRITDVSGLLTID